MTHEELHNNILVPILTVDEDKDVLLIVSFFAGAVKVYLNGNDDAFVDALGSAMARHPELLAIVKESIRFAEVNADNNSSPELN